MLPTLAVSAASASTARGKHNAVATLQRLALPEWPSFHLGRSSPEAFHIVLS